MVSCPGGEAPPTSAQGVWLAGAAGAICHYDGVSTSWSKVPSPTSQHLSAVWGSSASRVYAVGVKNTALKLQP